MKTLITITNGSQNIIKIAEKLFLKKESLKEVICAKERHGYFFIENECIEKDLESIDVINILIHNEKTNPKYHLSVNEDQAKNLLFDIHSSILAPYCDFIHLELDQQKFDVNNCKECFIQCSHRMCPYERNPIINKIFNAYCKEIYDQTENEYERLTVAIAKGWLIDQNYEMLQKYALSEEELFQDFINKDFNNLSYMTSLIKKRCPETLHYYFHKRKKSLKEMIETKYINPWV